MQTVVCENPGSLVLKNIDDPIPSPGKVLLKIKHVGICGTDLHAFAGNQPFFTYPRILGHELSAEVVDLNSYQGGNLKPGDEVVVIPYKHCGKCFACRKGKTNCCEKLSVFGVHEDGGMQQYFEYDPSLLLPAEGLLSREKAIVEPLCIGTHAVERAEPGPDSWVIISGCGPIGVGIIWAAQARTDRIIALDVDENRLNFCRKNLKVPYTVSVKEDVLDQIREITGGLMAQVVFDATGIKAPMEKAIDYLSPTGKYVLVGLNRGNLSFNHPSMHARELSVLCSRNATISDFENVIRRMQNREFPSSSYITHEENFRQIPQRFDFWKNPENQAMKVVTQWD
ncbi:MAG: zinc-binding alcohol dehydrogenase family protein [Saprospiraceae bacterium]|nr:zinc-binding alcohol dehydrogenase family protein [Saprospiraceae bacterium]